MKTFIKILLIFFLLVGCGSRKVQKSVEVQKELTTETVKVEEVKTDNTKTNIVENTDEVVIEPIDTIAPMIVDGKVYKNARLRRVNKKVVTNIAKDIKETKKTVKQAKKKASTEIIKKEIDKKTFCWLWLLLLIIPIYYLYRKYKNLIWFI
jgi:PBP1b-binding outer membrane lipoprotein LpoB